MAVNPAKIRKPARKELEKHDGKATHAQGAIEPERAMQALRDSEERFRATFEQAAVGIAHTTTEGKFLQVNGKLCEILGYTDAELLGLTTRELTHPDDRDKQDAMRLDLLSGRRSTFSAEKRLLRKDGSEIWINRTVTLARRPTTGETYLIQVIEDVSERKQTDARLGRLTRARRVMAECNHILVHATDEAAMLDSMCRVVVESGGYKMAWVGLATGDPARPVYPAAHAGFGDDTPMTGNAAWGADGRYRGFMCEVLESGEPHIARNILQDPTHARRLVRAKQRGFQSSIALPLTGDGRILGAIAMYAVEPDAFDAEEITLLKELTDDIAFGIVSQRERVARRNAEAALQESEQQFRATFEQAAVGISRVDLNGVLVDVNQKFCDMLGYGKDELLGKHIRDITHPDDYGRGAQYRAELMHRMVKSTAGEKRFIRKDGTVVWARRTMSTACDASGKPLYVISVVEDITERKELERRFELTFNHAAVGMIQAGLDGRLVQVNQKYADMLGYTCEELRGMSSDVITHPEDLAETLQTRMSLIEGRLESVSSEKRLVRKDGRVIWVNRTVSVARDSTGEPLYFITIVEDISSRKEAEAERAQLAAIVEGSDDAIISTTLDRKALTWNAAAERMFGYTAAEVLGRVVSFLIPPDRIAEAMERRKLLDSGRPVPAYDTVRIAKDGRRIDVSITQSPIKDANGRMLGVSLVFRDIAERKQAEERYRATFDNAPVGIMHTTLEDNQILQVNPKLCEMLGFTRDELLGVMTDEILHPDYRGTDRTKYREAMLNGELNSFSSERVFVRKDGSSLWVNRTVSLVRDASGKPLYFIRIVEDASARKQAEETVAREHALLRAVVDAVPDAIYVKDREGRYLLHNTSNARTHGAASPDELLGKTAFDIFPRAIAESISAEDQAMVSSGTPVLERVRGLVDADGVTRWLATSKFPLRDAAEGVIGIVGVNRDITERTQSERRRAMEHAVTSILAEAMTIGEALPRVIQTICEGLDWTCGFHWSWDRPAELLRCREHWYRRAGSIEKFVRASLDMVNEAPSVVPAGKAGGLVRKVWVSGEPVWISDVMAVQDLRRAPAAAQAGLHSAFGFPVLSEGRPVGIMEFFSNEIRQPDEALLQAMRAIGSQIGQFIQRKEAEAALHESEEQFKQLANNIPQVFWITDVGHRETIYISPAAESLTGRPLRELHDDPRALIRSVHKEDRRPVYEARKSATGGGYDQTYRVIRPDGTVRWVHDRAFPVSDETGTVYRIAGIVEDVTDRKFAEERLMQLAHYDVLTNLPNRVLFYDRLRQVLAQAKRNQWIVGVMFVDLDRFKNVNDTLGHAVGDTLLQQVSERLTRSVRSGDTVGRLGGDEFAIVLSSLSNAQDASLVAQKVMASFKEPFLLGGSDLYVTASIGVTLYPDDSTEQDALIRNADSAMYRAKESGRNSYQFYTPEMNSRALEILSMETSLRGALDRGEFLLYYQPKASIADGSIVGVEALLRWQHPERGLVAPAEFMFVLEETGLIVQVGEWVLRRVCAQIKAWERAGITPPPVAVNLSARQFNSKDFGPTIGAVLQEQGVDPGLIELEITESSLMMNTDDAVRTLEYLSRLGVGVSIDDFGTGYSSLSYLKRFPLDALKIDRSFVRDLSTDSDDATIIRAVISMAHSLGLKVIAEGVETEEQLAFLAENGCDEIQGYYFSYPLEVDECGDWIRQARRLPRG